MTNGKKSGADTNKVHHFKSRVEFEDCDALGVVYHPNYLRFVERARVDFLRRYGLPFSEMMTAAVGLVVAEANVRYLRPLKFEQEFEVYTRQISLLPKKLILEQIVTNTELTLEQALAETDRVPNKVCVATLTLVPVDRTSMRSTHLPDAMMKVLSPLTFG